MHSLFQGLILTKGGSDGKAGSWKSTLVCGRGTKYFYGSRQFVIEAKAKPITRS